MRHFKTFLLLICLSLFISPCLNAREGTPILGESALDAQQMWEFVRQHNPDFPKELAEHYLELGKIYGIRGDMALCQAIIETGWFKFSDGTAVKPSQHNYCGLGVVKRGTRGLSFSSPRDGVTAQMQHLYAYACKSPLPSGERKLDKRFELVSRGSSTTWEELSGRWASNPRYGSQILALYGQMTASAGVTADVRTVKKDSGRKYRNGRDRRKDNEAKMERLAANDTPKSVNYGKVGPVTARYLGIDLSRQRNVPAPADSVASGVEESVAVNDREQPENVIQATRVDKAGNEEPHQEISDEGTALASINDPISDGNVNSSPVLTILDEKSDTVSVARSTTRIVKVIRRR